MDKKFDSKTIRNVVYTDYIWESYVTTPRNLLMRAMKAKRHENAKIVLRYLKHNGESVRIVSWENIFTIDSILKCHNDHVDELTS